MFLSLSLSLCPRPTHPKPTTGRVGSKRKEPKGANMSMGPLKETTKDGLWIGVIHSFAAAKQNVGGRSTTGARKAAIQPMGNWNARAFFPLGPSFSASNTSRMYHGRAPSMPQTIHAQRRGAPRENRGRSLFAVCGRETSKKNPQDRPPTPHRNVETVRPARCW